MLPASTVSLFPLVKLPTAVKFASSARVNDPVLLMLFRLTKALVLAAPAVVFSISPVPSSVMVASSTLMAPVSPALKASVPPTV